MTCKDCIHNEVCYGTHIDDSPTCCDFKDKSRFVELPCKVGTYVYFITDVNGHCFTIKFGRVYEISMTSNDNLFLSVAEYDGSDNVVDEWNIPKCQWGKTVFLAREEAEKALKERKQ